MFELIMFAPIFMISSSTLTLSKSTYPETKMDGRKRGFRLLEMASQKGKKLVSKEDIFKSRESLATPKVKPRVGPLSKKKLTYEEPETLFESQSDIFASQSSDGLLASSTQKELIDSALVPSSSSPESATVPSSSSTWSASVPPSSTPSGEVQSTLFSSFSGFTNETLLSDDDTAQEAQGVEAAQEDQGAEAAQEDQGVEAAQEDQGVEAAQDAHSEESAQEDQGEDTASHDQGEETVRVRAAKEVHGERAERVASPFFGFTDDEETAQQAHVVEAAQEAHGLEAAQENEGEMAAQGKETAQEVLDEETAHTPELPGSTVLENQSEVVETNSSPENQVTATQNTNATSQNSESKKSNWKNAKKARKIHEEQTKKTTKSSKKLKDGFSSKLKTVFFKAQSLHSSLAQDSDYFVAVFDSIHKETAHGTSPMSQKYIISGQGQFFDQFIANQFNPDLHYILTNHDDFKERKPTETGVNPNNPCCNCQCRNVLSQKRRHASSSDEASDQEEGLTQAGSSTMPLPGPSTLPKVRTPGSFSLDESSDPEFNPGTKSFTKANRGAQKAKKAENKKKVTKPSFSLLEKLPAARRKSRKNPPKKSKRDSFTTLDDE